MLSYIRQERLKLVKYKLSFMRSCSSKHNDDNKRNSDLSSINLPEVPTTCCMSACPNCVWIEYANQLNEILRDGGEKSLKIIEEKVVDLFSTLVANDYNSETKVVSIEENECSDASFLVTSFIWEAITVYNAEIMEILFHNSVQHYRHLISKIPQNISSLYNKPKTVNLNPSDFIDNNYLSTKKMLSAIREFCCQQKETNSFLVIDDISYVYLLSSLEECIHFIRCCLKLSSTYPKLRVVIGTHTSSDDEELNIISKLLQHCSKFNLIVKPLRSGFSSEVTGHMTISNKTRFKNNINKYYYKLEDKNISINPYIL